MAFFLAIDNGGTKADFLLADETRELARVRTGTLKRMRTDAATATLNLEVALNYLTAATDVSMQSITRTCIGTSGNTVPLVTEWLREAIAARVSGDLILLGDVEIALDAAFYGGPGVLALAGTGSNIAGRTRHGSLVSAGGWGPTLADHGSGHSIGIAALRAIFLAIDEERTTRLLDEVLDFWSLADLDELVAYANQTPAPDFSNLTSLVLRCAEAGDRIAATVLQKEGEDLGYRVRLVLRRMKSATDIPENDASGEPVTVAFAGSIIERILPVREALIAGVRKEFPSVRTLDGVVDPLDGALWRARTHEAL